MPCRWLASVAVFLAIAKCYVVCAQTPPANPASISQPAAAPLPVRNSDLDLVEKLIVARREYQKTLEQLRVYYLTAGDLEKARWAEDELRHFHRAPQQAYRLELDVPPPNLQGTSNIPEANKLFTWALSFKDKGWANNDYLDNQRRAELLLQELLSKYPNSDKISDAAYYLGDIYESRAYRQSRRAAAYFERCYQWNPRTQHDARIRAARIYDRSLNDRAKALELYREVTTHEIDARRIQEANKRLQELSSTR